MPANGSGFRGIPRVANSLFSGQRRQVHLLSFHTEGPPYDVGPDLTNSAQTLQRAAIPYFDSVFFATPRGLIQRDESWRGRLRDMNDEIRNHRAFEPSVAWNTGWARIGLFGWKPRLLLERLDMSDVRDRDIVFYHDSDTAKYPEYLKGVSRWSGWLLRQMRSVDVLVFRDNRARFVSDTKPELWEKFFSEDEAGALKHLWAGAIGVRKTPAGIEFIRKWDELAKDFENLSPITRAHGEGYFSQHGPDQGILACLRHSRKTWPPGLRIAEVYLGGTRSIPPPRKPLRTRS